MLSFTFNNKDSYQDFGIVIKTRPTMPLPERNVNYIEVLGRNGSLTEDIGTYKDIVLSVDCFVYDEVDLAGAMRKIKGWLSEGQSELIFSHIPDTKYIGQVTSQMDITPSFKVVGEFTIQFKCQPYSYPVFNPLITILDKNTIINNSFTATSDPEITIYGSGNITLTITDYWGNIQSVTLTNVSEYITINSAMMECYKGIDLFNEKMSGKFPKLVVGNNTISWIGSVVKIEVLTNFRFI